MKPLKKMTATTNTVPATMPTHAATAVSLLGLRLCSCGAGGGGGVGVGGSAGGAADSMGPVVGSVDVGVSLMFPMIVAVLRCWSRNTYESAMKLLAAEALAGHSPV